MSGGYWIYKDYVTSSVKVHRDDSSHSHCKWIGASSGALQPWNWEHVMQVPSATQPITIWNEKQTRSKSIYPHGCSDCMDGHL